MPGAPFFYVGKGWKDHRQSNILGEAVITRILRDDWGSLVTEQGGKDHLVMPSRKDLGAQDTYKFLLPSYWVLTCFSIHWTQLEVGKRGSLITECLWLASLARQQNGEGQRDSKVKQRWTRVGVKVSDLCDNITNPSKPAGVILLGNLLSSVSQ